MKKFLFLIALFTLMGGVNSYATKLYATYGTPAGNGSWDAGTGVYSWTNSSNNLMDLFTFGSGELVNYVSLHFSTSDYVTGPYRVCFMQGSTAVATIAFYSAGDKDLVFSERSETKSLDLSQITSIKFGGASGSGSITITKKPYIAKPMSLTWGDDGTAEIDITDLTASNGFSLNDQTGELTGTGSYGVLSINLPVGGVDLSSLTGFSVTYTGENLFNNFEIGDGTTNKGFWSSVTGRDDLNQYMTVKDVGTPTAITNWKWFNNSTTGTMTISSIKLKAGVITASNPHETLLTSGMFIGGCENHFGEVVGQGTTIYGNGSVLADQYVDLSAYDEMRVYGTPNKKIRLLFNWGSANQKEIAGDDVKLNSEGYYSLDLSTVAPQQLNAFKFPYDGQSGTITKVILYKNTIPVAYSYVVSGSGFLAPSATAALADASATSYDATGVTGTGVDLSGAANTNALFVANSGVLANTSNVIVSGTCANLALTDGNYPFKAPSAFTATSASYNRTFTAGTRSTVCLPFALTAAEAEAAGTFYELSGVNPEGTELTFTDVTSGGTTAYKPYIFVAKADGTPFTGYAGKTISATPATFAGTTVEGYTLTGVLAGSSDVAADNEGKTVYGWSGNSGQEGTFVKVGTGVAINPFRAYVVYNGGGASLARMAARFIGGSVTGINEVSETQNVLNPDRKYIEKGKIFIVKKGVKYNAAGQKVN